MFPPISKWKNCSWIEEKLTLVSIVDMRAQWLKGSTSKISPKHIDLAGGESEALVNNTHKWFSRYISAAMLVDGKQKITH